MTSPTQNNPTLIGLLVDVSGSMMSSIKNSGIAQNRLEGFRDSLERLIKKHAGAVQSQQRVGTAKMFAFGFGFGNPLAEILGRRGPTVRDLFLLPNIAQSTVDIVELANQWPRYRSHVEGLTSQMFGSTPMKEGLEAIRQRFESETQNYSDRILFFLSDGEPDSGPDEIIKIASSLKARGVLVVSCFVTSEDLAEPRHIYGKAASYWSNAARLMFECSSVMPQDSPFHAYLKEYGWTIDPNGRLFTQINQSEVLSEFMNVVLSPLEDATNSTARSVTRKDSRPSSPAIKDDVATEIPRTPEISYGSGPLTNGSQSGQANWPAWIFGGLLVLFFMCIVWFRPQGVFNTNQEKLLKILASVLVGVISGFFAGALRLEGKVPLLKDLQIGAIGGFAGFALTFFLW